MAGINDLDSLYSTSPRRAYPPGYKPAAADGTDPLRGRTGFDRAVAGDGPPPAAPTIRTDAPGGGYLVDQMNQAGQAINRGEVGRGLGIAARGAVTSPLVAGYESFQRVGEEMAPVARGIGNFVQGFVGAGGPSTAAAAKVPTTRSIADMSADVGAPGARRAPGTPNVQTVGPSVGIQPTPSATTVDFRQSDTPGIARNITDPINGPQYGSQLTIPKDSMMALSPETSRALYAAKSAAVDRGETGEPGYRGPLPPGRGIAGDFDFATDAAARFEAQRGNGAKAASIQNYIAARDAAARGDAAIANANATTSTNAAANLHNAQAGNIAALTPAQIGLTKAQGAEALGRNASSLATTAKTLAETGDIAAQGAGKVTAQNQTNEQQAIALRGQKELEVLRQKALQSGAPADMEKYSAAVRASVGKGGNVTAEDLVKAYTEYLVAHTKANAMSATAPAPLDYQTFTAGIHGKLTPENDPRAASIRAQLQSGKIDRDEAKRQWAALGYQ